VNRNVTDFWFWPVQGGRAGLLVQAAQVLEQRRDVVALRERDLEEARARDVRREPRQRLLARAAAVVDLDEVIVMCSEAFERAESSLCDFRAAIRTVTVVCCRSTMAEESKVAGARVYGCWAAWRQAVVVDI
jgi:hypothetical protein